MIVKKILLVSPSFNYLEMPWIRHLLSSFYVLEVDYSEVDSYPDYFPIFIVSDNSSQIN